MAQAGVTGFVNDPTTNLEEWTAAVGSFTTNIDFDNPNNGASVVSTPGTVMFGAGPGQGNTTFGPLSGGEGLHAPSNFLDLQSPGVGGTSDTIINFSSAVSGAGLDVIDLFGVAGNTVSLMAYDGANGTGDLLGSFTSVTANFQENNIYFMGVTSSTANIQSIVFQRNSDPTGDEIGLDNIVSASGGNAVPEPAAWALMLVGFGGLGAMLRRRRTSVLASV
jgi:hypothetical protein